MADTSEAATSIVHVELTTRLNTPMAYGQRRPRSADAIRRLMANHAPNTRVLEDVVIYNHAIAAAAAQARIDDLITRAAAQSLAERARPNRRRLPRWTRVRSRRLARPVAAPNAEAAP